jgi:hypothetical protein
MDARPFVALTRAELAAVLAARGRAPDADEVVELRAEALRVAAELGLRTVERKASGR